jgi:hypothetical protein
MGDGRWAILVIELRIFAFEFCAVWIKCGRFNDAANRQAEVPNARLAVQAFRVRVDTVELHTNYLSRGQLVNKMYFFAV